MPSWLRLQVGALQTVTLPSASDETVIVAAGDGNDTINISGTTNNSQALNVQGGSPSSNTGTTADTLNVTMTTAGTTAVAPGATPDAGVVTSPDGTTEFSGLEFVTVTGTAAGANTLNGQGTNGSDTMALQSLGGANRIWVNDRAVVSFANYQTVNLNGLFGDDIFSVTPNGLAGVTAINVAGGTQRQSDELIVTGTTAADAINYTTSDTQGSGSVAITGAPTVNFTTTESLVIDGQGGGDTLTVTTPGTAHIDTYTPGTAPDAGTIAVRGIGGGAALVPLTFTHLGALGAVDFAGAGTGTDTLELNGTANSDTFNLTGATNQVQILNSTAGFVTDTIGTIGVGQITLRGLDGNDTFNISGTLASCAPEESSSMAAICRPAMS